MKIIPGLLVIFVGTYLGYQVHPGFGYAGIGLGLACWFWDVNKFVTPKKGPRVPYHDADLDQTCELNYDPKR